MAASLASLAARGLILNRLGGLIGGTDWVERCACSRRSCPGLNVGLRVPGRPAEAASMLILGWPGSPARVSVPTSGIGSPGSPTNATVV